MTRSPGDPGYGSASRFLLLAAALFSTGCGSTPVRNTLIEYPEMSRYSRSSDGCVLELVWDESPRAASCQPIGDIYVGESGFTSNCGEQEMVELTRRTACGTPADLGVMREIVDWNTTCTNIRTQLYACGEPGSPEPSGAGLDGGSR